MQTPVSSLPLSPPVKVKLLKAGFQSAADLLHIKPLQLSKEAGVSPEEAVEVLQTVRSRVGGADGAGGAAGGQVTALDLLEQEEALGSILTFCSQLDAALGGGLPVGKTTEICGPPGVGKTQLCLQVCVDVQVPECFGGLGGQAVFVDTEGSFMVHRLAELAEAAVQHLSRLAEDQQQTDALRDFTVETILSNVFVVRCHDYTDLLAELYLLPDFLSRLQKPRLLVIDSVASPFRRHDDMSQRTRLLNTLAQQLIAMATSHHVAVVMTNQMTTRVGGGGSQSELVPALGESWGHAPTLRLMLQWAGSERRASLYKTPNQRETSVSYQITAHGFRDTDASTDQSQHAQASTSQSADTYNLTIQSGSHNKRARIQED